MTTYIFFSKKIDFINSKTYNAVVSNPTIEVICATYGQDHSLKCFINSFLSQTSDNWILNIVHDGPEGFEFLHQDLKDNKYLSDPRIFLSRSKNRNNDYGHSCRKLGLEFPASNSTHTVITNGDNYYVPQFIEILTHHIKISNADFIAWDFISHNDKNSQFDRMTPYGLCNPEMRLGCIDMGAVCINTRIARHTGFKSKHHNADWHFFEKCIPLCNDFVRIDSILFVHN